MIDLGSLVPSKHQAAGHDGCLISEDSSSVFAKLTNQQEIDFYLESQSINDDSPIGSVLSDWMPIFYGTLTQGTREKPSNETIVMKTDEVVEGESRNDDDKQYIVLQNLYYTFSKPNILDIKLGSKLTDNTVTPEKEERLRQVSRSTTSGSHGFRICGMKIYDNNIKFPSKLESLSNTFALTDSYYQFDKFFGRSLNESNIVEAIDLYFNVGNLSYQRKLLTRFLQRLQLIYNTLIDSEVRIISGSLLFIYEADLSKWSHVNDVNYEELDPLVSKNEANDDDSDDDENDENGPLSSLNLIDFAHAKYVKGKGCDENILQGIENLIKIFEILNTN